MIHDGSPSRPGQDSSLADRRRRRSADPLVALHYHLSGTRARGRLDAIVVADASGVVVAGAGSWPVCEELAAYAPLLAEDFGPTLSASVSSRVESLRQDVEVRAIEIAGQEILICARRHRRGEGPYLVDCAGDGVKEDLELAAEGVSRILTAVAA